MLPLEGSHHYLEQEFELARRTPLYARMIQDGALGEGLWFLDLEDRDNCYFSPGFWRILGVDPASVDHRTAHWSELVFAEDWPRVTSGLEEHLADPNVPFELVVRCRTTDGATVRLRTRGVALHERGTPKRLSGVVQVISDTREDELSETMTEIMDLSRDAISVWSAKGGIRRWNRGAERLFGLSGEEVHGKLLHDLLDGTLPAEWEAISTALREGRSWSGDIRWVRRDGGVIHTTTSIHRISVTFDQTLMLQVDHDITAKVQLRERQRTLTRELNHRVKNLFAVIRSLVKLSAMGQDDVPRLVRELDQRIAALAAAHIVSLGYEMNDGGPLGEILDAVLSPYPADRSALSIDGPPVCLPQSMITPMGLILNELATNALKYGAWSTLQGSIDVSWTLERDGDAARVRLVWKERSPAFTPPDPAPQRRGFGSDLIEMSSAQLQSVTTRAIEPDGIRITLTFQIEQAALPEQNRSPMHSAG